MSDDVNLAVIASELKNVVSAVRSQQETLVKHADLLSKHMEVLAGVQQHLMDQRDKCTKHWETIGAIQEDVHSVKKDLRGNGSGTGGLFGEVSALKIVSSRRDKLFWILLTAFVGLASSGCTLLVKWAFGLS